MNNEELLRIKQKIETASTKISELKGELKSVLQTLKEEHQCHTIEEGEKKMEELSIFVDSLKKEIEEKSDELKANYPQLYDN